MFNPGYFPIQEVPEIGDNEIDYTDDMTDFDFDELRQQVTALLCFSVSFASSKLSTLCTCKSCTASPIASIHEAP